MGFHMTFPYYTYGITPMRSTSIRLFSRNARRTALLSGGAFACVALLIASECSGAPILPQGYDFPSVALPSEGATSCATCRNSPNPEIVSIDSHGMARMNVDLAIPLPFAHDLLRIELGKTTAFMPSTSYLLCTPGDKNGLPDSIVVYIGERKVLFDAGVIAEGGAKVFRAKNYHEFSLAREGDKMVLKNLKSPNEMLFESTDAGMNWRIAAIRRKDRPASMAVHCEYSSEALMTAIVNPDGTKYLLEHKGGLPTTVTDPAGAVSSITYDAAGHITSIITSIFPKHPLYQVGETKKPQQQKKGLITREIHCEMDAVGRLISVVNSSGEKYMAQYQKSEAVKGNASGKGKTAFALCSLTRPDGLRDFTRISLNADGTKIEARGRIVVENGLEIYRTNAETVLASKAATMSPVKKVVRGRTRETLREGSTLAITKEIDPIGRVTTHKFDADNREIATIFPDKSERRFSFDASDRLVEQVDEMGRGTVYAYNEKGQLTSITDKGLTTVYQYDDKGFPVKTLLPGNRAHCFAFDALGRLLSHTPPDGVETRYVYLPNLDLVATMEKLPAQRLVSPLVTRYEYEPLRGRVAKIEYPDKSVQTYKYFCCGVTEMVDRKGQLWKYAYDNAHNKVLTVDHKGQETRSEFNENGFVTKEIKPDKSIVTNEYDPVTGLWGMERSSKGTWMKVGHDEAGRMDRAEFQDGTECVFAHDKRDRLISCTGGGGRFPRLERTFDLSGLVLSELIIQPGANNPVSKPTIYKRDAHGRVIQVERPDGTVVTSHYDDSNGDLVAQVENGIVTRFLHDDAGRVVAVSKFSSEELRNCQTSEERETLAKNKIAEEWTYDEFGELRKKSPVLARKVEAENNKESNIEKSQQ